MTAFLAWIYAASAKVYAFFGSAFTSLYNGALNAWTWAVNQAQSALNSATTYAFNAVNAAKATLNNYLDLLNNKVNVIRDSLIDDIIGLSDWVVWKLGTLGNLALEFVDALRNELYNFIQAVRDDVNWLRESAINYVIDLLYSNFGWVLDVRDAIMGVLSLMNSENINILFSFLYTWLNTVIAFFQNPLGFLFDVMQPLFLQYVEYMIAMALGTTVYEMPTNPFWRS